MKKNENVQVGIGFATGRKGFQKVLRSYVYNWKESGLVDDRRIELNLFIAYDLSYKNTKTSDFTELFPALPYEIKNKVYIGNREIRQEIDTLVSQKILSLREAELIFSRGYAARRNAALYFAIKNQMDYLLFLDDDEYPVAVTNTQKTAVWGGQHVLSKHLEFLPDADITHGRHCGYISPIPYIEYNKTMTEQDFRMFIEAISNDILSWDKISTVMKNGGVTYADPQILSSGKAYEVEEQHGCKFISGSNLGINLKDPSRVFPFYNPPGARGEDTFLSTCLSDRKVMRMPCYTFHDGFSTYNHLLEGVLPIHLKYVKADNELIIERFYRACIGWVRYKPLYVYVTKPEAYEKTIGEMRKQLRDSVPKLCAYFKRRDFSDVPAELEKYHSNVINHYKEFLETKQAWESLVDYLIHIREIRSASSR